METNQLKCSKCSREILEHENFRGNPDKIGDLVCSDCVNQQHQNRIYDYQQEQKVYLNYMKLQLITYPIGVLMVAIFSSWFTFPSISVWLIISFAVMTIPYHKYFLPMLERILDMLSEPADIKSITITKHSDGTVTNNSGSIAFWNFIGTLVISFIAIVLILIFGALTPLVALFFLFKYLKIKSDIKFSKSRMIYDYKEEDKGKDKLTYDLYIDKLPYQYHDALAQYLQKRTDMDEVKAYQTLRTLPALVRSNVTIGDIYEDFLLLNELITTIEGVKYIYSIKPHDKKRASI